MKILNAFSGLGGNRKLWEGHEITAVEIDPKIAEIYKDYFPSDTVIVGDAHQYLLDHFKEFDFIWSSPPCPTHSSFRHNICVRFRGTKPEYPDMMLYQEILLLKHHFAGKWVIENVKPYYDYLIKPDIVLQRHPFWCNFKIEPKEFDSDKIRTAQIPDLQKLHKIDLSKYQIPDKRKLLRNCVYFEIGDHILQQSLSQ